MMFKVGSCNLYQRVFRTGGLRQLIQREMLSDFNRNVIESKGVRKTAFSESRIVVCTECYKKLEKGEGVDVYDVVEDILDGDKLGNILGDNVASLSRSIGGKGRQSVLDKVTAEMATKSKEKSDAKLKKERKPRGVRVSTKGSTMIKSLAECTFEDEDTDEKPKEKKRGRKPRSDKGTEIGIDTDPLVTEASESDKDTQAENFLNAESEVIKDDVVIPTSMPSLEEVEPTKETIVTNKDRAQYKEQVRQALGSKCTITYAEIAQKLGCNEGLVSQLADELEVGA